MGQVWKPNKAFSNTLLSLVLEIAEMRISQVETEEEIHQWIVFVTYSVVSYVISLRGVEGFLIDLEALQRK